MRFPSRIVQFVLKRSLLICLVILVPYVVITSIRPFALPKSTKSDELDVELFDRVVDGSHRRLKSDAQFNRSSSNYEGEVDEMMR